jgi:hypothetical protein
MYRIDCRKTIFYKSANISMAKLMVLLQNFSKIIYKMKEKLLVLTHDMF